MAITEEQHYNALTVKVTKQDECDKIHQLNHETFAEEIPLHDKRQDEKLVDAFPLKQYLYNCVRRRRAIWYGFSSK